MNMKKNRKTICIPVIVLLTVLCSGCDNNANSMNQVTSGGVDELLPSTSDHTNADQTETIESTSVTDISNMEAEESESAECAETISPVEIEGMDFYDGDKLTITNIQLHNNSITFSLSNHSTEEFCYSHNIKMAVFGENGWESLKPYKEIQPNEGYYVIAQDNKINITSPAFYEMGEGRYAVILQMYDKKAKREFFLACNFEMLSNGNLAPLAKEKISLEPTDRFDNIALDRDDLTVKILSVNQEGVHYSLVNNSEMPYSYGEDIKIMKKEGECYDIIYPDNEVEVLDILYGIEPKEEKDIISPAIYDLNPGDYRFFIPIHEPREQISFYSICDFSIT